MRWLGAFLLIFSLFAVCLGQPDEKLAVWLCIAYFGFLLCLA